jgi:hypothetical protein
LVDELRHQLDTVIANHDLIQWSRPGPLSIMGNRRRNALSMKLPAMGGSSKISPGFNKNEADVRGVAHAVAAGIDAVRR